MCHLSILNQCEWINLLQRSYLTFVAVKAQPDLPVEILKCVHRSDPYKRCVHQAWCTCTHVTTGGRRIKKQTVLVLVGLLYCHGLGAMISCLVGGYEVLPGGEGVNTLSNDQQR